MKTFDGYKKQALTDVYALLAGGGHKLISDFATNNHTHSNYVTLTTTLTIEGSKTFTTGIKFNTNKNGDANLGSNDGFKLFYNETSGSNFPGNYYNVASFMTGYTGFLLACYGGYDLVLKYRHREDNGTWHPWKTLAFTTDIPTSLPANGGNADTVDGYHANGLLTALSNSNNGISITVGGTTKSISNISVNYANSAGNADTLDNTHLNGIFTAFGNNAHNITATIGGTTKSFLVNWAADSDKLDGYHENSFLRYRETTSIDLENTLWDLIGIKLYNGALPDNLTNVYNYGSVISLPCTSTRFEIYASELASLGNGLYYRSGWRDTKRSWLKFIDSSNIGSQSVNYANSAGNADTLDGEHAKDFVRAGFYENNDLNSLDTYSFIRSVNSQVSSTSPKGDIGWYNVILLVHRNGDGDGPNYIGLIALGMTSNVNDIFFRCRRTDPWKTIIHSNNYTEFINNYYWANVKISTTSSTTTSPTVSNLTATSSIRMGNIYLLNTNEINSASGIHLNYQNSGNVSLCVGGGNVGIGAISPSYKLNVNGNIHSSGTINCNALNVDSTLSIKDSVIGCSAGNISILSKESGSLLINSREVLKYDSDFIYMNNRINLLHGLCFKTSILDSTYDIYTTDDVTVLIGVLSDSSSFKFRPAHDGLLLFLKIGKLYSNTYFWCTAENCVVVRAKDFGIYLDKNLNKDCFGDGLARIFIYIEASNRWFEFYCG